MTNLKRILIAGGLAVLAPLCAIAQDIHAAAKSGDLQAVKSLLSGNPKLIAAPDNRGDTPLHRAALEGHKDIVAYLISRNGDIHKPDQAGNTPLHGSAYGERAEVVKILLAHGAHIRIRNRKAPLRAAGNSGVEDRSRRPGWMAMRLGLALMAWGLCPGRSLPAAGGPSDSVLSGSLPSSAGDAAPSEDWDQDPLRKGIEYLESKHYEAARRLFQSIWDREKGNHEALFYLGKAYFLEEKFSSSIEWLEKAVLLQPRNSQYHYWLARANEAQFQKAGILRKMKYGKRFRDEIQLAVQLDGNNPDARFWLMMFYLTSPRSFGGDWNKALEQAKAVKKIDLAYGYHALITAFVRAGKFDLAEKELLERVGNFPDRIDYRIDLSWFYLDQKNYSRAFQNSTDIIENHPQIAAALFQIGRAAAESDTQRELGKRSLSKYIGDTAAADRPFLKWAHCYLGEILASEGDPAGARSEYSKALRIAPDFAPALQALKKLQKGKK